MKNAKNFRRFGALLILLTLMMTSCSALAVKAPYFAGRTYIMTGTEGNGTASVSDVLAYSIIDSRTVDVVGYYTKADNTKAWLKTTYDYDGYALAARSKLDSETDFSSSADSLSSDIKISGPNISFTSGGAYIRISYDFENTSTASTTYDVQAAIHADVMIADNDRAKLAVNSTKTGFVMVDDSSTGTGAQFNLEFGDVSTYWFGYYNYRKNHLYQMISDKTDHNSNNSYNYEKSNGDYVSISGTDSGFAFSWAFTLAPYEKQTRSFEVGIGSAAAAPQWPSTDPFLFLQLNAADNTSLQRVQVDAKMKDEAARTEASLWYKADGKPEAKLASIDPDGTEQNPFRRD